LLSHCFFVFLSSFGELLSVITIESFVIRTISTVDIFGIIKPNLAIQVFEKLSFHLQDFFPVNFLDVIAILQALFIDIGLVVPSLEQIFIFIHVFVVIVDFLMDFVLVQRGEEVNRNRVTAATICLDACLNHLDRRPISVRLVPEHNIAKELSIEYFDILFLLFVILVLTIPKDSCVLLPL